MPGRRRLLRTINHELLMGQWSSSMASYGDLVSKPFWPYLTVLVPRCRVVYSFRDKASQAMAGQDCLGWVSNAAVASGQIRLPHAMSNPLGTHDLFLIVRWAGISRARITIPTDSVEKRIMLTSHFPVAPCFTNRADRHCNLKNHCLVRRDKGGSGNGLSRKQPPCGYPGRSCPILPVDPCAAGGQTALLPYSKIASKPSTLWPRPRS